MNIINVNADAILNKINIDSRLGLGKLELLNFETPKLMHYNYSFVKAINGHIYIHYYLGKVAQNEELVGFGRTKWEVADIVSKHYKKQVKKLLKK